MAYEDKAQNEFSRTELLIGNEAMKILQNAHIAVFGIGGVGGFVVEALVRSGIQHIDLIDNDKVSITNLNRQIIATHSSLGKYKVDVMKERILDINPNADVKTFKCFYLFENRADFDFSKYDYVVDAVDTVSAKIGLIMQAKAENTKIISSMGFAEKLDATQLKVADIYETSVCPLARVIRAECRKRGIKDLKVVYSTEKVHHPIKNDDENDEESLTISCEKGEKVQCGESESAGNFNKSEKVLASISFVPSVAGLIIAGEVIKDLIKNRKL